jgi:hypothetical protein
METIRWVPARACITAALFLLGACSHDDSASKAQDQSAVQTAASGAQAPGAEESDTPAADGDASSAAAPDSGSSDAPDSATSPVADVAAPTAAPSGGCRLIDSASVEKAMHDRVDTVTENTTSCDFTFKIAPTHLTVEYDAAGGADDLDLLRKTVGGATSTLNAAASAAPVAPGLTAGVVSGGTPSVPKLGDDQFAFGPFPALFLGVRRGDTYVQISGAAMPNGLDAWAAAVDLVRETFANQH